MSESNEKQLQRRIKSLEKYSRGKLVWMAESRRIRTDSFGSMSLAQIRRYIAQVELRAK